MRALHLKSAISLLCHESDSFSVERIGTGGPKSLCLDGAFVCHVAAKLVHYDLTNDS